MIIVYAHLRSLMKKNKKHMKGIPNSKIIIKLKLQE